MKLCTCGINNIDLRQTKLVMVLRGHMSIILQVNKEGGPYINITDESPVQIIHVLGGYWY